MKTIPAGNIKYLLLDSKVLERNVERSGAGAPPVIVVEVDADSQLISRTVGYKVAVIGTVVTKVFPRGHLLYGQRAGWMTCDEVIIDAVDPAPEVPVDSVPPTPAKPRKPVARKVKVTD